MIKGSVPTSLIRGAFQMGTTRKEVRRFQTKDEEGNRITLIEYRITIVSDEIRPDRMLPEPTFEEDFKTADGRDVAKTYQLLGTGKIVREA
jgi:hypothetical protein